MKNTLKVKRAHNFGSLFCLNPRRAVLQVTNQALVRLMATTANRKARMVRMRPVAFISRTLNHDKNFVFSFAAQSWSDVVVIVRITL